MTAERKGEIWIVDDNNSHDGKGPCYAVLRSGGEGVWSVLEVDPGFKSEDKILQDLVDSFVKNGNREITFLPSSAVKNPLLPPY